MASPPPFVSKSGVSSTFTFSWYRRHASSPFHVSKRVASFHAVTLSRALSLSTLSLYSLSLLSLSTLSLPLFALRLAETEPRTHTHTHTRAVAKTGAGMARGLCAHAPPPGIRYSWSAAGTPLRESARCCSRATGDDATSRMSSKMMGARTQARRREAAVKSLPPPRIAADHRTHSTPCARRSASVQRHKRRLFDRVERGVPRRILNTDTYSTDMLLQ